MSRRARQREDIKRQRGWSGGWTEYRYGPSKPITLAGQKQDRIFRGQKRDHVVKKIMDLMRDWRLSPFEFEGSARIGIRSRLCLDGHGWNLSDVEAADLVQTALRHLGAVRPSWGQGQPEYLTPRENCLRCGGPLDEYRMRSRFCSPECAGAFVIRRGYEAYAADDKVRQAAFGVIRYTRTKARKCEQCGKAFHPISDTVSQRFCSKPCMYAFRDSEAAAVHRKECTWCGTEFVAKTPKGMYCTPACQLRASRVVTGKVTRISPPVFDYVFRMAA